MISHFLKYLALASVFAALAGCSSTRTVDLTDRSGVSAQRFNETANARLAHVRLGGGDVAYAVDVEIEGPFTTWLDPASGDLQRVHTRQVEAVTFLRAGEGALFGLAAGVAFGVATGLLRAQIEGADPISQGVRLNAGEKYYIYPAAHSAYVSLGTTTLGAIIGRKHTYHLIHP